MNIPLSWLKEYVPTAVPVKELAHRLTMAGTEVASVTTVGGAWDKVYVGQVLSVEKHPNADRLKLATVDIGSGRHTVVCGAPNVAQGQRVAFALEGARLIDPKTGSLEPLKAARIRGVLSAGMVCSERELGLGEDHTGIMVLPDDAPVGVPLTDYLGDTILDLEVTANRPDCLSVLGLAYEVAALTGQQVTLPDVSYPEEGPAIDSTVSVQIAAPDLCPRYTASLIAGVKIGPSPRWLQERLLKAGMRSINNVVDITNYVMLEYGQPLHAFDFDRIKGRRIVVRQARTGETVVTLDGVERRLAPPMLVISDERGSVALAGVMGDAITGVTEQTTAVLLESASFDPANTRRTAQALKLHTEASVRFEKGLRPELPPIALRRATQLVLQMAGGKAAQGIADVYPGAAQRPTTLSLTAARLKKVLGTTFPPEQIEQVLSGLGFKCIRQTQSLQVHVPYWRSDITVEDDLVEEVARVVGYDQIPTTTLATPVPSYEPQPLRELRERVRDLLASLGLQEAITYPLVGREDMTKALVGQEALRVANPLSPSLQYLRPSLRPSLLRVLSLNLRLVEDGGLCLFEAGRIYIPRAGDLPAERELIGSVMAGRRLPLSWSAREGAIDFFDAKGVLEALLGRLRLTGEFQVAADPFFQPGRCATVVVKGVPLGFLGEVHPLVLERFDIDQGPVAFFELDIESLLEALPGEAAGFTPLPRYPGVVRDLAVVVDEAVSAGHLLKRISRHALVTSVLLFDVFKGGAVPPGKRSLAYRITFQAPDRTLTAEEANSFLGEVLETLHHEFEAVLRT